MTEAKKPRSFAKQWAIRFLVVAIAGFVLGVLLILVCEFYDDRVAVARQALPASYFLDAEPTLSLPGRLAHYLACLLTNPVSLIPVGAIVGLSWVLWKRMTGWFVKGVLVGVNLAAFVVDSVWTQDSLYGWPVSILGDHTLTEIVNEVFPRHLVSPAWFHGSLGDGVEMHWMVGEFLARTAVVAVLWLVAVGAVYGVGRDRRNRETRIEGNCGLRIGGGIADCELEIAD